MSSEFGKNIKISVFGQSHGKAIGVCVDGLPAGFAVDTGKLHEFMRRRSAKANGLTTPRREKDAPIFLSGLEGGVTCASPMCAIIENNDAHSSDYAAIADTPRPSHADYAAHMKWGGCADMRGGGHFSGRLTAPLCVAGGIAKQILEKKGIFVGAHLRSVGEVDDERFPLHPTAALFDEVASREIPAIDEEKGALMAQEIKKAAAEGDSVGGTVECAVIGLPAGLGDPMFDGVENRIAAAVFGIPAVKGVEFGAGFEAARMRGSACNDSFVIRAGKIETQTNNSGGIQGGITNAMPVVFSAAIKPTPSIGRVQKTVSLSRMEETEIEIKGRHDPCVALRAVPVVEAVAALTALDMMIGEGLI